MNRTGFRLFLFILLPMLLWPAVAVLAGPVDDRFFREGNEAYSRGEYAQAIEKYQRLTETAGYAPGVLYNLANSHALAGEVGRAILNYERALRLSSSDSDVSGNLQLVKKENGLFPGETSRETSLMARFFRLLNLNQWSALIPLSLILLTIFLVADIRYRFSRQLNIGATVGCLVLLCLATTGTLARYQDFNPSVVISADVKLFISPFDASVTIGAVPEGRLVYPQKNHGNFSYVTDETGRRGWIPSSMIEPVCHQTGSG
jgi:tetratricopeptide (TPR) repeat protein